MKTKECIHCETFFDCKGKPSRNPCVSFNRRKAEKAVEFHDVLQQEMENLSNGENK